MQSSRQELHDNLALDRNIFAGTSFAHSSKILHKRFTAQEMEQHRKQRISKTLEFVPKSLDHNRNVSQAVKQAWKEGKFNTKEAEEARQKGYAKRRSYVGANNPMYGKPAPKGSGRGKGGIRKDLGHYVRSRWEANVCRICTHIGRKYQYEPKRFYVTVNEVKYSYCPDLFFPDKNLYYEIKGHARSSSDWDCECKSCIKNKKIMPCVIKQYDIKLKLIGRLEYNRFKRTFSKNIDTWEKER